MNIWLRLAFAVLLIGASVCLAGTPSDSSKVSQSSAKDPIVFLPSSLEPADQKAHPEGIKVSKVAVTTTGDVQFISFPKSEDSTKAAKAIWNKQSGELLGLSGSKGSYFKSQMGEKKEKQWIRVSEADFNRHEQMAKDLFNKAKPESVLADTVVSDLVKKDAETRTLENRDALQFILGIGPLSWEKSYPTEDGLTAKQEENRVSKMTDAEKLAATPALAKEIDSFRAANARLRKEVHDLHKHLWQNKKPAAAIATTPSIRSSFPMEAPGRFPIRPSTH